MWTFSLFQFKRNSNPELFAEKFSVKFRTISEQPASRESLGEMMSYQFTNGVMITLKSATAGLSLPEDNRPKTLAIVHYPLFLLILSTNLKSNLMEKSRSSRRSMAVDDLGLLCQRWFHLVSLEALKERRLANDSRAIVSRSNYLISIANSIRHLRSFAIMAERPAIWSERNRRR